MNSRETGALAPRRFTAATSREALRLARHSLGDQAMVLASRAVPEGFEVVAIGEGEADALVQSVAPDAAPAAPAAAPPDAVLTEILAMRTMIEERLASVMWSEQQRRDPVRGQLLRTMLGAGFSSVLSKALLDRLPAGQSYADGLAFVRAELVRALPVLPDEDALLAAGGVYALVGPTGVGKTTTTAKLAARYVMQFGAERIALVTTDGYRVGAYEQLRIYGQILGVPVHPVKDTGALNAVLKELAGKHMVLIDTVGMSQRDRAVADQIAMLANTGRPVRRLLLLNAASQGDTLNEVVYAWQRAGQGNELAGAIFTKLDETTSHGALLDTVIRHRLPVHYLSDGQRVPENLVLADAAQLVDDVLKGPRPGALFAAAADLAAAAPAEAADAVASAKAESDRLRQRYGQLIRAMAHDAQEIAATAADLERADAGFGAARLLWKAADDAATDAEAIRGELLRIARSETARACDTHVLAVCGRAPLESTPHGDAFDLQGCVLLSDRTGQPFAAPNQWLASGDEARTARRPLEWLRSRDFGRPLVHVLPRLPSADEAGVCGSWLARTAASTAVVDERTGSSVALSRIELAFAPGEPTTCRGRAALRLEAQAPVRWRPAGGEELAVRCIATRVVDATSGRVMEQAFALTNVPADVEPARLAQWQRWGAGAESCLRMASQGVTLLGGLDEPGSAAGMKRLLVTGQAAATAWRLQHATGERAERTRVLLTELAGRQVRPGRNQSGAAICEGLAKLLYLLDAIAPDESQRAPLGSVA